MPDIPDTTIVNLHRLPATSASVSRLEGHAWLYPDGGRVPRPLEHGDQLSVGDMVAVAPDGRVDAGPLRLFGGARGATHSMIGEGAFRPNPGRAQVPRLLLQLSEIEEQMGALGGDPLAVQPGPETPFERAASADFARSNLVVGAARELSESTARRVGAVPLFINEETAFVAMASLSVEKLRTVMEALERPVNPHMVEDEVLEELLARAYTAV